MLRYAARQIDNLYSPELILAVKTFKTSRSFLFPFLLALKLDLEAAKLLNKIYARQLHQALKLMMLQSE